MEDGTFYAKVKVSNCDAIEKRLNSVWLDICRRQDFVSSVRSIYITRHSELPVFYHLIKTHKKSAELKIRPIVANTKGPTKKLSWLLVQILRPLLWFVSAHLESSPELIKRIEEVCKDQHILDTSDYPCSFDVVSLYTSILEIY